MRRVGKVVVLIALVAISAGSRPASRRKISAPAAGNLSVVDGQVFFSNAVSFNQSRWYLLGTQIKFDGGGYLAHRLDATAKNDVFITTAAQPAGGWMFDQEDITQPTTGEHQLTRIKAMGGPLAGYYLSFKGNETDDPQREPTPTYGKRWAILVRDRAQAPTFEVKRAKDGQ